MYLFAWLVILLSAISIVISWKYFHNQSEICKKYPFYKFRDKVIHQIAKTNNYTEYEELYRNTNYVIGILKRFDFKFYSDVITKVFQNIFEEAYKNNWQIDNNTIAQLKAKIKLTPLEKEFAQLILDTARLNSVLLRIFMTKICYRIFFTHHIFKAVNKFVDSHPELCKKKRLDVRTLRNYSYLNYLSATF